MTTDEIITLLGLQPHPREGGYFAESYRSGERLPGEALPRRYGGERTLATAIYYLLTRETFSRMHRLASDEVFHFYLGDPVQMLQLLPDGSGRRLTLGADLAAGMRPQLLVPRHAWQGSRLLPGGRWALLGATVSPGFEYADYEDGDRHALTSAYPQCREEIEALTRP